MESKEILVGRVVASQYRRKILLALKTTQLTPSQIADSTQLNRAHVSRFLKEMRDAGLVECKTCDLRKGKLHSLTELGRQVLRSVTELEKNRASMKT